MTTTLRAVGRRFLSASVAAFAVALLLGATCAQAGPVTIGTLSSNDDGSTTVITDTTTGRQYLRWDELLGLTYAQTQAATADNTSAAYGFSFAKNQQAQEFVDALLSANSCTVTNNVICQSPTNTSFVELVGDNYNPFFYDYAFFISDNFVGHDVGVLTLYHNPTGSGFVEKANEWSTFASADYYANGGGGQNNPITWLLYRDAPATSVPDPASTGVLFATGLAALAGAARRLRSR